MADDTCPVVRVVCDVCEGNPHGFKEVNAEDVGPDDVLFGDDGKKSGRKARNSEQAES